MEKPKKETKEKPKYNMWQNSAWMVSLAWKHRKTVLWVTLGLAVATAGQTIIELLVAPAILSKVETAAPLGELFATIALFTGLLALAMGSRVYLEENAMSGRVEVRTEIIGLIGAKMCSTAYPNTLSTRFQESMERGLLACDGNSEATEAVWTTWTEILTNLMGFAVYLALLSGLHPALMAVVVVTAAASYLVGKRVDRWEYDHRKEQEGYLHRLGYVNQRGLDRKCAKDIRIFTLRPWLEDVRRSALELSLAFVARREKRKVWPHVADFLITLCRNGVAYAYLLWVTVTRGLPASQFLLYFGAVTGFASWVGGLLKQFGELHTQSMELSIIRESLEWPEPFRFEEGKPLEKVPGGRYEITLEDVSFRYPEAAEDTISHLSLTLRPGEKVAIVGLNGAGKTTLVKLICGFLDPTEGRVLLNGEDIRQYNRRDYYALFSAVFQSFSVLDARVDENVAQRVDGIDENRVRDCLDKAGLTEKVEAIGGLGAHIGRQVFEDGVELSGGETQRLMLARALYKDGAVLLLDEPTAALDPLAENDIYMKYAGMTQGRTALFISHRLASTRFCDRVLYMEKGKIAEEGTHETLLAQGGGYAKLFEVQSQYYREGGEYHGEEE